MGFFFFSFLPLSLCVCCFGSHLLCCLVSVKSAADVDLISLNAPGLLIEPLWLSSQGAVSRRMWPNKLVHLWSQIYGLWNRHRLTILCSSENRLRKLFRKMYRRHLFCLRPLPIINHLKACCRMAVRPCRLRVTGSVVQLVPAVRSWVRIQRFGVTFASSCKNDLKTCRKTWQRLLGCNCAPTEKLCPYKHTFLNQSVSYTAAAVRLTCRVKTIPPVPLTQNTFDSRVFIWLTHAVKSANTPALFDICLIRTECTKCTFIQLGVIVVKGVLLRWEISCQ